MSRYVYLEVYRKSPRSPLMWLYDKLTGGDHRRTRREVIRCRLSRAVRGARKEAVNG